MADPAEAFEKMAQRIKHNSASPVAGKFGGAVVIIPPDEGGEPIEVLIDDSSGDPAQFYSTIMTRIKMAVDLIDQNSRKNQAFGR